MSEQQGEQEEQRADRARRKQEHWLDNKWRPVMGWVYMGICILDFALFPVLWSILQMVANGSIDSQWNPISLQGAGLFHISMGAILGVSAWTRGQEKIRGLDNERDGMRRRKSHSHNTPHRE
jgi:hypothetical protein